MKGLKLKYYKIILFLLPGFLIYFSFMLFPTIRAFQLSLYNWSGLQSRIFVGLANYYSLMHDKLFLSSLMNTLKYMLLNVPLQVITAYILAYLLYLGLKGYKVFRFIFFIPVVLLTVAVGIVFNYFFSNWFGAFKPIFDLFDLVYQDPFAVSKYALYAVILTDGWKWLGTKIMLFYAGFQGMPEDVLEAAAIDGANGFQTFFKIIIPLSWEILTMVIILMVIGSLKVFDLLYVLTQGGPNHATEVVTLNLYKTAFSQLDFGTGCAIAVVLFIITITLTILLRKIFQREVF
jgi:ABC-type sugar transport system permease subunit